MRSLYDEKPIDYVLASHFAGSIQGVNLHRRERLVFIHDYKYAQIMTSKLHVILAIIKEMRRKITHIRTRET
jgi:hypothetical protein